MLTKSGASRRRRETIWWAREVERVEVARAHLPKRGTRSWKVVWWTWRDWRTARHKRDRDRGMEHVRNVKGRLRPDDAWRLFWILKKRDHTVELWKWQTRVL